MVDVFFINCLWIPDDRVDLLLQKAQFGLACGHGGHEEGLGAAWLCVGLQRGPPPSWVLEAGS